MIVMPADHVIRPDEMFRKTVRAAVAVVDADPTAFVTFGVKPTRPETGYGYIEQARSSGTPEGIAVESRRPVPREARPADRRAVPGGGQVRLERRHLRLAGPRDPRRTRAASPRARRGASTASPRARDPSEAETCWPASSRR